MRININIGNQNNVLNISGIKKGLNKNNLMHKGVQQEQKDSVSISPLGKANSIIESLMKQKKNVTESKNKLISRTLEKGGSIESIKSQLDDFDKQLTDIDTQIAQIMAEFKKQQNDKQEDKVSKEPKTEDEIQAERFNSIISQSSSLNLTQVASSVKIGIDGEVKVLESENKLDQSRGGASASKKEHLADLQKQSANLAAKIRDGLADINEEIADNNAESVEYKSSETNENVELNTEKQHKTEPENEDTTGIEVNKYDSEAE